MFALLLTTNTCSAFRSEKDKIQACSKNAKCSEKCIQQNASKVAKTTPVFLHACSAERQRSGKQSAPLRIKVIVYNNSNSNPVSKQSAHMCFPSFPFFMKSRSSLCEAHDEECYDKRWLYIQTFYLSLQRSYGNANCPGNAALQRSFVSMPSSPFLRGGAFVAKASNR